MVDCIAELRLDFSSPDLPTEGTGRTNDVLRRLTLSCS